MEEKKQLRVAIYARESSDDTTKAPPIQAQIDRCKHWIEVEGHILTAIYQDDGYSGGNWNRPSWNKIVEDAKSRKFRMVVTWSHDRLARDTEQFLWFSRMMRENSVRLYSLNDGEIENISVGDTAKNVSMALASDLMRKITSEKMKATYQYKKKYAEKNNTKIKWGRNSYLPKDIDQLIFKLKKENPSWGYRKIASNLPTYESKPDSENKRKTCYISHAYVAKVLRGVNNTPPKVEIHIASKNTKNKEEV